MGFGASPFGSMPFGTTFTPSISSPEVLYIEYLAKDLTRIWFTEEVIVNSNYLSTSNYSIIDGLGNTLPILQVIKSNIVALNYVLLKTNPQIEGVSYTATVVNLVGRTGVAIAAPSNFGTWTYQRTKGDNIVSSMPEMYDTSAGSNLRSILQAIANEDNIAGGSLSGVEND